MLNGIVLSIDVGQACALCQLLHSGFETGALGSVLRLARNASTAASSIHLTSGKAVSLLLLTSKSLSLRSLPSVPGTAVRLFSAMDSC